jgi:hypothetical protein
MYLISRNDTKWPNNGHYSIHHVPHFAVEPSEQPNNGQYRVQRTSLRGKTIWIRHVLIIVFHTYFEQFCITESLIENFQNELFENTPNFMAIIVSRAMRNLRKIHVTNPNGCMLYI